MRFPHRAALAVLVSLTAAVLAAPALAAQTPSLAGHWEGSVQLPNRELSIAVDLDKNAKGEWIGDLDVLDQQNANARDFPLAKIKQDGAAFSFEGPSLPNQPVFEGKISDDGKSISGTLKVQDQTLPFQLKRTAEAKVTLPPPGSPLAEEFAGDWEGALDAGGQTLRLLMHLKRAADGTGSASLDSLDQNSNGIPVAAVVQKGKDLELRVPVVNGSYKGKLNDAGTEIAGEWTQNGNTLPLSLKKKK